MKQLQMLQGLEAIRPTCLLNCAKRLMDLLLPSEQAAHMAMSTLDLPPVPVIKRKDLDPER